MLPHAVHDLGPEPERLAPACAGREQDKLVTSIPRDDGVLRASLAQHTRQITQELVAFEMTPHIVERFETIQVGKQQGAPGRGRALLPPALKPHAVEQTGQGIQLPLLLRVR